MNRAYLDWLIDGEVDLPLDLNHDQLTVSPQASVGGGYYVVSLLFFDQEGAFLAENIWIEDTDMVAAQTLASVKHFAAQNDVSGATRYRVRIRINPVGKQGAGFVFDRIAAVASTDSEPE